MARPAALDLTGGAERTRAVRAAMRCADELGDETALFLFSLVLAEKCGWLPAGSCEQMAARGLRDMHLDTARPRADDSSNSLVADLRARSGGRLPLGDPQQIFASLSQHGPPPRASGSSARDASLDRAKGIALQSALSDFAEADPALESFPILHEALAARSRSRTARRQSGLYYTPPEVAAQVVELALAQGPRFTGRPRVFDCCAGAGVFLLAAARSLAGTDAFDGDDAPHRESALVREHRLDGESVYCTEAALLCAGSDLDAGALRVAGAVLTLFAGPSAPASALRELQLAPLDTLRHAPAGPPIDLLLTNPPYGHASDARTRNALGKRFPALQGGEIDLYAAFILRALELVRPGGTAALLVPDTWMTNARSSRLRSAVLERAELCAVADLGKPFAAAKDTRVQALVLARRENDLYANDLQIAHRERSTFTARLSASTPSLSASIPHLSTFTPRPTTTTAQAPFASLTSPAPLTALAPILESELRARIKSGWQPYRSRAERALASAMESASLPLSRLCEVGYGLRTGDNPRHLGHGEGPAGAIGLVGGDEIEPFALKRKAKWLRDPTPELLRLAGRQLGSPRVAIQRIRTNSSAPWARWLEAALVPASLVCLDSISTLAAPTPERQRTSGISLEPPREGEGPDPDEGKDEDELLWALVALCSSVALNRYHRLQTTDVNVKPSALRSLPAPSRLQSHASRRELAALSKRRALALDAGQRLALERAIDGRVYDLYALDASAIDECERGFWGPRFAAERARLEVGAAATS